MNIALLNKKWSSFFNWTILYPLYLYILFFAGIFLLAFSSQLHLNIDWILNKIPYAFYIFIFLLFLLIPYGIWFIISADALAKALGWNRIVFNVFNLFMIFSMLYFVTVILFWIKIKDKFEDAGYDVSWSGKLK